MAREISTRLKITGQLTAETPLHVGGFGTSPDTDLPLARNGKGEWYVPGTSIAGVLRSWCERNFGEGATNEVWGFQRQAKPEDENRISERKKGHASFVLVEDAQVTLPAGLTMEIRDGVGIDRCYGVAADRAKFDRAILPRGAKLDFALTVEIEAQRAPEKSGENNEEKNAESKADFESRVNRTKAVFGHVLAALRQQQVRFGAARTRGLGRVALVGTDDKKDSEIKEQSLIGFQNILDALEGKGSDLSIEDLQKADPNSKPQGAPRLEITIHWKPRLPVMVKAGYDGIGVDMLPLTSGADNNKLALVLPGSSLKGALRSHAERIVRTVLDSTGSENEYRTCGLEFHRQIDDIPLVSELFGARNKPKTATGNATQKKAQGSVEQSQEADEISLGLGALAVDDCYAEELLDAKLWRKVEVALDAKPKEQGAEAESKPHHPESEEQGEVSYFNRELWRALREIDERKNEWSEAAYAEPTRKFSIEHHVAIDRWTGGAAEGALYSVLAPRKVSWRAMRLTVDFGRFTKGTHLPALMLLLLTLRDVAENRLPFGFATNRGMGEIEVTGMRFAGQGLDGLGLSELENFETNGSFAGLQAKDKLKAEWNTWHQSKQRATP